MPNRVADALYFRADRLLRPLSERWWRTGRSVAVEDLGIRSCLVVVPHPDDETIGAGATIAALADAGVAVHVAVATDGSRGSFGVAPALVARARQQELAAATTELGLRPSDVDVWEFEDGTLPVQREELAKTVQAVISRHDPDTVMTTCRLDPHGDHMALGAVVADVASSCEVRLLEFPVWTRRLPARALSAPGGLALVRAAWTRRLKVSTGDTLPRKAAALGHYRSQMRDDDGAEPHPLSGPIDDSFAATFLGPFEFFLDSGRRTDSLQMRET